MTSRQVRTTPWWAGLVLALHVLLLLALGAAAIGLVLQTQRDAVGVTYGPPPYLSPTINELVGVNVSLEQYDAATLAAVLHDLDTANLRWLRQRFAWADIEPVQGQFEWTEPDRIVHAVSEHDLQLIATLDGSPAWARSQADSSNPFAPPSERADFGRFAAAFAHRYGQLVDYYQIWDEPNIAPHWGSHPADPAGYLGLLREGGVQVKAADPTAWILLAALAPTVETGGVNLSDVQYLERLYQLGGDETFDIAAAQPYGFDSAPGDSPSRLATLDFGRAALLREVMERYGDQNTPLWAVEFGWNALPPGWSGGPSIWGQVDEATQARYASEAVERAQRDWPWMGAMFWASYQPALPPEDPHWGFALIDQSDQPRPALTALADAARGGPRLTPGPHRLDHPALRYSGGWRVTADAADIGRSGDTLEFEFFGTRLDLDVQRGPYWAYLTVTVDGQPANSLPKDGDGNASLVLYDPLSASEQVTLAHGLQDSEHQARIVATGGWGQWALRRIIVSREQETWPAWLWTGLGLLALLIVGSGVRSVLRPATRMSLRWCAGLVARSVTRLRGLDERWLVAATLAAAALFTLSRWLLLDLVSLALLTVLLAIRTDLLLPLIAFAIPFFPHPKTILDRRFSHIEILTLLGTALLITQTVSRRWCQARGVAPGMTFTGSEGPESPGTHSAASTPPSASRLVHPVSGLDWPVLAFVCVSALSLLTAGNRGVALRELRVVIVDAALFYLLVTRLRRNDGRRFSIWPAVDGLVVGALAASCIGLGQLVTGQGRVDVEGVWRVRALYGSPNNLGLYLGRIVPLLGAVTAFGRTRWRRRAYGLLLLPIGMACIATFSKGALLVGLPAALLFLGLARSLRTSGRRNWRPLTFALVLLLLASVAMVPLFRTERFAGLFDFTEGTSFVRLQLWQGALNMALDRPWLGVGLDNFLYEYRTRYVLPSAWRELNLSHPHNIVLDFWTRLGLLGLASGLWLLGAGFRSGWRLWRRMPGGDHGALLLGLLASLVATVAHGLIDNSIFLVDLAYVFLLTLGVFQRLDRVADTA